MSDHDYKWAVIRRRAYRALPVVVTLLVYYGATTEHEAGLWAALAAAFLSNTSNFIAAKHVNVSRETFTPDVSRETIEPDISVPCPVMHGSAEPHVLGCEGWDPSEDWRNAVP